MTILMIDTWLNQLTASARAVIAAGYWTKPEKAKRPARQETEFVATLIDSCVGPLTAAWGEILRAVNLDLTIQGAFLHQRPKVRFPSPTTASFGRGYCELADLLLVHDHSNLSRKACLIQAKTDPGAAVAGDQKDLYEKWEPFRFSAGSKGAKGRVFSIAPNDEGSRYGIVRVPPPGLEEPWLAEQPLGTRPAVDMGWLIAEMLAATVAGRSHPARSAKIGGGDEWSDLIEHLLTISLHVKYPLKGFWAERQGRRFFQPITGLYPQRRYSQDWIAFATSTRLSATEFEQAVGYTPPGRPGGDRLLDVDEPEGLSVIYLNTVESLR